jgi:hypothetical protein
VLKPCAKRYISVPSPRCTAFLFWRHLLIRLRLRRIGEWYANLTLRRFKANHLMEAEEWATLLSELGFDVEHHEPYMPRKAARIQDLMLPTVVLSVLSKSLFGRPLVFPRLHRITMRLFRNLLQNAYQERAPEGSGIILVVRRPS